MVRFDPIFIENTDDIAALSTLASGIVKEYYDPIVGPAQNDYMIEKFQSVAAITQQLRDGYHYVMVYDDDDRAIGFLGFYPREQDFYLSKFYLRADARGKGYGKQAFAFIQQNALRCGRRVITLNVNKRNPSIAVYEAMGMRRIRAEVNDIGNGYVMDDYVYQYCIPDEAAKG